MLSCFLLFLLPSFFNSTSPFPILNSIFPTQNSVKSWKIPIRRNLCDRNHNLYGIETSQFGKSKISFITNPQFYFIFYTNTKSFSPTNHVFLILPFIFIPLDYAYGISNPPLSVSKTKTPFGGKILLRHRVDEQPGLGVTCDSMQSISWLTCIL